MAAGFANTPDVQDEIVYLVERLRVLLDDLVVRGLRGAGDEDVRRLVAARDELDRLGAAHLAGRLARLADAVASGGRSGADLLAARTSLQLFESLTSREAALARLAGAQLASAEYPEDEP